MGTPFIMLVKFGFLHYGQIPPPYMGFGPVSLRTDTTYINHKQYSTHSNSIELSLVGVGQLVVLGLVLFGLVVLKFS